MNALMPYQWLLTHVNLVLHASLIHSLLHQVQHLPQHHSQNPTPKQLLR
jgi:hypothetical protein